MTLDQPRPRRRRRRFLAAALLLPLVAAAARGQGACGMAAAGSGAAAPASAARTWPAPLDRTVTLRLAGVPLRTALDQVAAESGLRLSYSAELLPVDRPVCLVRERVAVGDALGELLAGTGVAPLVAGGDQIVLAPARAAATDGAPTSPKVSVLDRVVVTGAASGTAQRSSPFAVEVLDGRALARTGVRSLAQALDAAVPGLWVWAQSPAGFIARYGSVRGASSFGVSAPKVYVDGIEVANPLLLTDLDPERVERVEVIRGPQGAALYGADAISGVVSIVTRHEGVGPETPAAELRASVGTSSSDYGVGSVLVQDHALSLRAGTAARSAALGVTMSTVGQFIPGASARQISAIGNARVVGSRSVITGTARLNTTSAGTQVSPVVGAVLPPPAALGHGGDYEATQAGAQLGARPRRHPDSTPDDAVSLPTRQSERQYTLGATATFERSPRWTHTVVVGVDGYRLAGVAEDGLPVPSAADSALRAARGGADRGTLRVSSTARLGTTDERAATVTLALEQSTAREQTFGAFGPLTSPEAARYGPPREPGAMWWSNTGALAQTQLALGRSLFLSGGGRVEWMRGPGDPGQVALLPMLGGAYVRERGPVTLKLRAAFGRGIRPVRTVTRGGAWMRGAPDRLLSALAPEEQSGVEAGADLFVGDRLAVHLTRFDQRASGLIQPVVVGDNSATETDPAHRHVAYELQNVGEILNRGWETQVSTGAGPLSLVGAVAVVDSRVGRVAPGYGGDLRAGDRVLEVPARTTSLTATWTAMRWSASWSVARASDWVNYDRLGLARDLAEKGLTARDLAGPLLRAYWRDYDGVTRMRATTSFRVWRGMALTLTGDNLLDRQRGEPDNITVLPGRTVTLGARTIF